jgi:hypothetical protein
MLTGEAPAVLLRLVAGHQAGLMTATGTASEMAAANDRQPVAFGNFARRLCLPWPCGIAGAVPPRDSPSRGGV